MIGYFTRQAVRLRAGNPGQATALFLVVAATVLVVIFASIRLHHVAVARVSTADSVDAIALSAATWEARCLNLIAALNDGSIQCFRVIRWTCAVWAALAVAAAFGFGAPAFVEYTREARRLIAGYWDTAHLLVSWSEKIRKAAPYLVLGGSRGPVEPAERQPGSCFRRILAVPMTGRTRSSSTWHPANRSRLRTPSLPSAASWTD